MFTVFKWILASLIAALLWLVGKYTVEYFQPYKK